MRTIDEGGIVAAVRPVGTESVASFPASTRWKRPLPPGLWVYFGVTSDGAKLPAALQGELEGKAPRCQAADLEAM